MRAAVRLSDQLEVMPGWVIEVNPSAAVIGVDLARPVARAGPKRDSAGLEPLKSAIEHVVGDKQCVMLAREIHFRLGVIEPDPVIEREAEKRSPAGGLWESEQVLQKRR